MSTFLHECTTFGARLGEWIAWMNLMTGLLVAVALLLDRLLASRVTASWRMWLYVAVAVRLALPLGAGIAIPWHLRAGQRATETPTAVWTQDARPDDPGSALQPKTAATVASWDLRVLVPAAYALGIAVLLARWCGDARALRGICRESSVLERSQGRSRTDAFTLASHPTAGPLLVGWRQPMLIVPAHLLRPEARASLGHVLAHEAAHCRRRDPLVAALLHLVVLLAWPVLPLWIAAARVRTLMELACDESAVSGLDGEGRRSYGRTLIDCASEMRSRGAPLAFGAAVRERVLALGRDRGRRTAIGSAVVLLCALGLAACASVTSAADEARRSNAADAPAKGTTEVAFTILERVPDAGLFAGADATTTEDMTVAILPAGELDALTQRSATRVLAAPRLYAYLHLPARVEVGTCDEGDLRDGFAVEVVVRNTPLGDNSAYELGITYHEARPDGRAWSGGPALVCIPAGHVAALLVRGASPADDRVVCVAARQPQVELESSTKAIPPQTATGQAAPPDRFDPLGGDYPQISWMVNVFEVSALPEVRTDGTLVVAAGVKAPGIGVFGGGEVERVFDSIRAMPGARLVAVPALMSKPGVEARISASDHDKVGHGIGDRTIALMASISSNGNTGNNGLLVTSEATVRAGQFSSSTRIAPRLVPTAGGLVYVASEPKGGDPWTVIVLRPTVLRSIDDFPFQTSDGIETQR